MRDAIENGLAAAGVTLPFAFVAAEQFGLSVGVVTAVILYAVMVALFTLMGCSHEDQPANA